MNDRDLTTTFAPDKFGHYALTDKSFETPGWFKVVMVKPTGVEAGQPDRGGATIAPARMSRIYSRNSDKNRSCLPGRNAWGLDRPDRRWGNCGRCDRPGRAGAALGPRAEHPLLIGGLGSLTDRSRCAWSWITDKQLARN